ncbi:hypothetical protein PILCRDRAFT_10437 [Piloderma croceum F 1598]|uniref:Uncharacterized protein n=1 Tax=Piloderma croceum (strain F 1598) TaxID=765440 RepID=A0A0C3F3E7_PILCF|nr:hypothetical protein PILCRDRAFT_10437 [Piloderma croceum F 1598]
MPRKPMRTFSKQYKASIQVQKRNANGDPYDLSEIHEATQFVLHRTPSNLLTPPSPPIPPAGLTITSNSTLSSEIKVEDIAAMIERITESFIKALLAQGACGGSSGDRPP